jgi:hypothetical protein
MQNDYGQKVLGEPIAPEIQDYFNNITKLQMLSFVGDNRSEIWLLFNNGENKKLIYDYFVNEWSERDCQNLTSYFVYNNAVCSTGGSKILREKAGSMGMFDGVFKESVYTTQIINLGSYSNMKEMEFQPLLTVSQDYNNSFKIACLIDGKKVKTKGIEMYLQGAIWGDDTAQTSDTPDNELWDEQYFPDETTNILQQVKGKFISNWYYLQFTFKTEKQGDDFSIVCMELKGITEESDTIGRK